MMQYWNSLTDPVKYGLIVFAAIFFVGWSTGMGGSFVPNLVFSILMGLLAGGLFAIVKKRFGKGQDR